MAAPKKHKHTPMIEHFLSIKREHPDKIVFYRMGDFYETFFEDAVEAAQLLSITLTKRNHGAGNDIPLAGVPHHALEGYLDKLTSLGKKVAICEQVENPKFAKGLVKRELTQIVTPGTTLSQTLLEYNQNNFLVGLAIVGDLAAVCEADLTTGAFRVREIPVADLLEHLARANPAELLAAESWLDDNRQAVAKKLPNVPITPWPDWNFGDNFAHERLTEHFDVKTLKGFGAEELTAGLGAAGAVLSYMEDTQQASLAHIQGLEVVDVRDELVVDAVTARNLEIMRPLNGTNNNATLVSVIDGTRTPVGGRLLRGWLGRPLKNLERIGARHDAVEALSDQSGVRQALAEPLGNIGDIERLMGKICCGRAGPRDLSCLGHSLSHIPQLREALEQIGDVTALADLVENMVDVGDMVALISEQLADDPPVSAGGGGVFRAGVHQDLDEMREISRGGKDWIANLEKTERARTNISTLKVRFNRAFGYFIEVSNAHRGSVPDDYVRKQTLVNAERYITPELKEYETKVLGAEEHISELEQDLFVALTEQLAARATDVARLAGAVATADVLTGLAEIAETYGYTRPTVTADDSTTIIGGRHPVVEQLVQDRSFVPNDVHVDGEDAQILVITGPNMAGKSTILRQVGLIVLMAHIGSFVPAKEATVALTDRIFTRVGAQDNLAGGESTFLVEMHETANILHNCTDRSLVLFDEVGRGTSTFDGLSIAWAIVEFLHNTEGKAAKTLFATHYHELVELQKQCARVKNFNVEVKKTRGKIVFLHKLVEGGCDHSYGIEVARLAGLPERVIERANVVLKNLEAQELSARDGGGVGTTKILPSPTQMSLLTILPDHPVIDQLRNTDLDSMSPMDLMILVSRWQSEVNGESEG